MSDIELVEIDIARDGSVVKKTDKVLIVDADTIAFAACSTAEEEIPLLPREFYNNAEWEEMEPFMVDGYYISSNLEDCKRIAEDKLNRILELTGCSKYELHFTVGRENFRYSLYKDYKANRKDGRAPRYLFEVKKWLAENHNGYLHSKIEADDAVAFAKRFYGDKCIIAAVDKDVLNALPGRHFNYYESFKHNISMKWVDTDEASAKVFPYLQALMGDKSDNIIGLAGIGPAKAKKLFEHGMADMLARGATDWELAAHQVIKEAFIKAGRDENDGYLNITLCMLGAEEYMKGLYKIDEGVIKWT